MAQQTAHVLDEHMAFDEAVVVMLEDILEAGWVCNLQ